MGPILDFCMGEIRCGKAVFQLEAATQHYQQIVNRFNSNPKELTLASLNDEQLLAVALYFDNLSSEAKSELEKTPASIKIEAEKRLQKSLSQYQQTSKSSNNWQLSSFLKKPIPIIGYWLLIARGVLPYVAGTWNQIAVSIACGLFLFRNKYLESQQEVQSEHWEKIKQAKKLQDFLVKEVATESYMPKPKANLDNPPPLQVKVATETQTDNMYQQELTDLQEEASTIKHHLAEALTKLDVQQRAKDQCEQTVSILQQKVNNVTSREQELKKENRKLTVEAKEKDKTITSLKKESAWQQMEIIKLDLDASEVPDLKQRITELKKENETLACSSELKTDEFRKTITQQAEEISQQASTVSRLHEERRYLMLEIQEKEKVLSDNRQLKSKLNTVKEHLTNESQRNTEQEEQLHKEITTLTEQLSGAESRLTKLEDLTNTIHEQEQEISRQSSIIEKTGKEKESYHLEMQKLKDQIDIQGQNYEELENIYTIKEKRLIKEIEDLRQRLLEEECRNTEAEDQLKNKASVLLQIIEELAIHTGQKDDYIDALTTIIDSLGTGISPAFDQQSNKAEDNVSADGEYDYDDFDLRSEGELETPGQEQHRFSLESETNLAELESSPPYSSSSSTSDESELPSIDRLLTLFLGNRELFISEFFEHIDSNNILKDEECGEVYLSLTQQSPNVFTNHSLAKQEKPLTKDQLKEEIKNNIQKAEFDAYEKFIKDFFSKSNNELDQSPCDINETLLTPPKLDYTPPSLSDLCTDKIPHGIAYSTPEPLQWLSTKDQ